MNVSLPVTCLHTDAETVFAQLSGAVLLRVALVMPCKKEKVLCKLSQCYGMSYLEIKQNLIEKNNHLKYRL